MSQTDAMVARLQTEIEERRAFQDNLIEGAQTSGRDLDTREMELYQAAAERIEVCNSQLGPLQESLRIAVDSATRSRELVTALESARSGKPSVLVEYRTAGQYINDRWMAGAGFEEARRRIEVYERAGAAHQTTPDNLGIIPETIVGSVLQYIDAARPITTALGVQAAPGGMFKRPRVTQHTEVGVQATQKTELVSRKMLIDSIDVAMTTIGGYVNVSRQNIDWSSPNIMDIVVQDLAAQYAIVTEQATAANVAGGSGATVSGPISGSSTADDVAAAVWEAAGIAYASMKGVGRLFIAVSPDMLGVLGPLFAPVNPTNAQGVGFNAGSFGSGVMGVVGGIPVIVSSGLLTGTAFMVNSAAVEVYEQRVGTLQVTEPSVLGVQVAYAGYFAAIVLNGGGIVKLDTP